LDFDNRPFQDVNHMHRVLINNYCSTVPYDGICYFAGDQGMGDFDSNAKIISQLHGTKVFIRGNHDRGVNALYRMGFDVVLYGAMFNIANKVVTMSHCPLKGVWREDVTGMNNAKEGENWHGESRHQKFTMPDFGQFHLHGHVHSTPEERTFGRQYDIGVPANNYRPVSFSEIESWISRFGQSQNLKG
jgi:calcineurin-like phosphoesterase family protein